MAAAGGAGPTAVGGLNGSGPVGSMGSTTAKAV